MTPHPIDTPLDQLVTHLSALLGKEGIQRLRQNPNFALPYADEVLTDADWLSRALQTILPIEDIRAIGEGVANLTLELQRPLLQQIEGLRWEQFEQQGAVEKSTQLTAEAQAGRERAEVEAFRLRKEQAALLPTDLFVASFFIADDEVPIRELLLEAAHQSTTGLAEFLKGFVPGWTRVKAVVSHPAGEVQIDLQQAHQALTDLLAGLSGLHIPQRRALLEKVAQWASRPFPDYIFVSPEESPQPDPALHNVHGLSGSTIVEGRSFAIIRRQSRTVVMYADVIVA
ncbi:hypothetical protein [Spirosoma fluviale]|uniref:Uncharacterized protein n=1 Tax=Spirosoma fluviale TaxID=1597977 RepID=A0A286GW13_9BACT|nr:hypothetical protein [Spirosoma fluviale]SOD99710.1 hypothetical protein SAMN06269250_0123 [Spirosoma fluviale]